MAKKYALRRSRSVLSSTLHVILNILLGAGSIALTVISGSWILGIVLVLISKWRIFAVRPRFWWDNIKANLVDLIVGASFVMMAYAAGTTAPIWTYIILAIGYTLWLIFLKPRSSTLATTLQAMVAVFLGTNTAAIMFGSYDSLWIVLSTFVIGYAAARHVLTQKDEDDFFLLSFLVGLLFAEMAWLGHSWLIVYVFSGAGVVIAQLSIILTIFAFVLGSIYKSLFKHEGKLRISDIILPVFFSVLIIAIIVLGFSHPIFNI